VIVALSAWPPGVNKLCVCIALDSSLNHSKAMDESHQVLTPTLTVDAPWTVLICSNLVIVPTGNDKCRQRYNGWMYFNSI
jgi:hypothetical protein